MREGWVAVADTYYNASQGAITLGCGEVVAPGHTTRNADPKTDEWVIADGMLVKTEPAKPAEPAVKTAKASTKETVA